jgi:hypothetical protein
MPERGLHDPGLQGTGHVHVEHGEGETEDHNSREEAETAADAVAQGEERTVVVEE